MRNDFENFCVKLPGNLLEAFRTIVANKGEEANYVLAQLIQPYVEKHKDISFVRNSGVIEVYVKSLLNLLIDWPPVQKLEADEFIELTVGEIHRKLVVTDDQARMVAFRIWQELRKAPSKAANIPGDGTSSDNREPT